MLPKSMTTAARGLAAETGASFAAGAARQRHFPSLPRNRDSSAVGSTPAPTGTCCPQARGRAIATAS